MVILVLMAIMVIMPTLAIMIFSWYPHSPKLYQTCLTKKLHFLERLVTLTKIERPNDDDDDNDCDDDDDDDDNDDDDGDDDDGDGDDDDGDNHNDNDDPPGLATAQPGWGAYE